MALKVNHNTIYAKLSSMLFNYTAQAYKVL